ncbi:MAG: glycosyltransferase family 39 protein [Anaerolineae bacterium]|nr:glycosyltransferase family 39 protein [Anaerolineae bacterium]
MNRRLFWGRLVLVIAALIWILMLVAAFYRVQKPFGVEQGIAWLGTAWTLIAVAMLGLTGAALGRRLLCWGGFVWASPLEELVWAWGAGLGVAALAVMGIGMIGGFYRLVFLPLTLIALLLLWRDARAVLRLLRPVWAELRLPRALRLFWGLIFLLTLTLALTPPAAWDALQYHLDGPRLYIEQHRITAIDNFSLAYSGLLESLFAWAMLLASDVAAQVVHWAFGVALAAILYLGGRRVAGDRAWLPLALLATTPMVLTLLPWAYNDLALAFYQVAAFLALCVWRERQENRWLYLSGLMCGFGLGFKYTAATAPLVLALLIPFWQSRQNGAGSPVGRWITSWLWLGLGAALVSLPWFLRNWALWGNPIYPYLFNGLYWDNLRSEWYQRIGSGIGWNLVEILRLPWTASLTTMDVSFREARSGPLWVLALPLTLGALLWPRQKQDKGRQGRTEALAAFGVVLIQYALWAYGVIQSRSVFQARLLLPTLALLALPVAYALERLRLLDLPQFSLRRFVLIVLTLVLILNAVDLALAWVDENPLPYLMGLESRQENLTRRLGVYYTTMQEINQRLSMQDRVLFLWETKGYYCRVPNQPDLIVDRMRHLVALEGDAAGAQRRLRDQGYTHVLIFETGLEYFIDLARDPKTQFVFEDELAVLAELRANYLGEIYKNGHYTLYRIK